MRAAKALGVVLWKERETGREHTETPGVRGKMRTAVSDTNRQQQRRGDTGKVEEGRERGG